ncbi:unnamed protein product, partial [Rotaria sp. Silwood1]
KMNNRLLLNYIDELYVEEKETKSKVNLDDNINL